MMVESIRVIIRSSVAMDITKLTFVSEPTPIVPFAVIA